MAHQSDYNVIAAPYARHRRACEVVVAELVREGQLTPDGKALEIGCGTGTHSEGVLLPPSDLGGGVTEQRAIVRRGFGASAKCRFRGRPQLPSRLICWPSFISDRQTIQESCRGEAFPSGGCGVLCCIPRSDIAWCVQETLADACSAE